MSRRSSQSTAEKVKTAGEKPAGTVSPSAPAAVIDSIDDSFRVPLLLLFLLGACWLAAGSVFSLIASIKFHGPGFLADSAWLTYGRVRPAATTAFAYGFCVPVVVGLAAWIFGRLGASRLAHSLTAGFGVLLWNLGVAIAVFGILRGDSTGFAGIEIPGYAAGPMFVAYLLLALAAITTLHRRRQRPLFVAQWFLLAALFWFPWIFSTAQLLLVAFPVRGMTQAVIAWWFANHLHLLCLSLAGLGILLYFIPKLTGRELQSRNLALFVFWTLVLAAGWSGIPHHAPLPAWLPSLSGTSTVLLVIPLLGIGLIYHHTLRGHWALLNSTVSLRFFGLGAIFLLVAMAMAVVLALPGVGHKLQLSWFSQATWWAQVYGFFCLTAFGAVYHIVPRLFGADWPWPKLASFHFYLAAAGSTLLVLPLALGGWIEGAKLLNPSVPFMDVVKGTLHFLRLSTIGDLLLLAGHALFLLNLAALAFGFYRARAQVQLGAFTADLYAEARR